MPHGFCYRWDPQIVWLHVISDALITLSYFCIPVALIYLARKRQDLPFNWILWMFGLFIVGCGTTHLMEIWTIWHASYLLAGVIKAATAAVSVLTAAMLVPLVPKAISLPSASQMAELNRALKSEIAERERAGLALRKTLDERERALSQLDERKNAVQELQAAQAALRQSQDRLHAIIHSAMDAIITVDEHYRVVIFNDAAEKMFGCSYIDALNQSIVQFIPERFRTAHDGHIARFGATGATSRAMGTLGAIWGRRSNGEEFPLEASISQIQADGKKLFTVILRDITERRRAQDALRESEERFHAMLNGIPQLAWMAEGDGHIFWYNQRWYEYTGTTFEQMEGWGWQRVHDPAVLPHVVERWNVALATGNPFDMEFPLRGADGQFRIFLTRVMPVKDAQGRVVRWFGTNTDISEQKQVVEEMARQAEQLARSRIDLESKTITLQLVLDNISDGLVVADETGKFIIWNAAAQNIVGKGAADIPSTEWSSHYHLFLPDTITPFPAEHLPLARALRGETCSAEMFMHNPELERDIWIEVTASPLRDGSGTVRGGVSAFRDITQRKIDEREIRALNEDLEFRVLERTAQLEVLNKELEAFSYSVSHDLRAPLRHIIGFAELLSEEFGAGLDPGAVHYLDRIRSGTQKMGLLVDALLNLARVGRSPVKRQEVQMNEIVNDVIAILQPQAEGRAVDWRVGELANVQCDAVLVKQVFQNLLANALKFTRGRESAVIEISAHTNEAGQAVFTIRDNGIGFDMKYVDKLFGVFQRLHSNDEFEGTGIGLATVQRIVQKHGGRVWAEGEPGKGAIFSFTLTPEKKVDAKANAAGGTA